MTKWLLLGKPYKVQSAALSAANKKRGYGFFLEMGLGKTAVVLAEYLELIAKNKVQDLIIVCPNSLKTNWSMEAKRWGVNITIESWPKIIKDRNEAENIITLINYEAIIGRGGEYIERIIKKRDCYLALDESVHVKNPRAKRTRALISLAKFCTYVRVLSGAPIVQSPLDVWGQLRVLGMLDNFNPYAFKNHFCVMGGYLGKQIVGARNAEELGALLDSCSIRGTKADWTDLPDKVYQTRVYKLSHTQNRLYQAMLKDFMIQLESEVITAPMVITQSMKLQQITSGFIIGEDKDTHILVNLNKNPKLLVTKELVEEQSDKVIVFAFYRKSIALLKDTFKDSAYLTGGMTEDEIIEQKELFNKGKAKVMIAQLTAAKYGHTLLGDQEKNACHTTVFYENNYDLDARIQAEDRSHRYGQKHMVTYTDLIGTKLDNAIVKALQKNKIK